MRGVHALLLTGRPGCGKTTVLLQLVEALRGRRVAGFVTQEMRSGGVRQGFQLTSFDGRQTVMAHVDFPKAHRVGKYGVDVEAIDAAAEALIAPGSEPEVYVIDEIGKMECLSPRFVAAIQRILDGPAPVVATIARRGPPFLAEIKQRPDVVLWEVTADNRDELPGAVLDWLNAR